MITIVITCEVPLIYSITCGTVPLIYNITCGVPLICKIQKAEPKTEHQHKFPPTPPPPTPRQISHHGTLSMPQITFRLWMGWIGNKCIYCLDLRPISWIPHYAYANIPNNKNNNTTKTKPRDQISRDSPPVSSFQTVFSLFFNCLFLLLELSSMKEEAALFQVSRTVFGRLGKLGIC